MHRLISLQMLLNLLLLLSPPLVSAKSYNRPPSSKDAILLSKVQALTLRGDRLTSSRRVSPIPQLKCTGPSARICSQYPIDTMRCTNAGYDYDEEDVQWTCTAELPPELKLGSTDVVCEGYRSADDPWVLKGSCGVEYRLLLTERGERMFGKMPRDGRSSATYSPSRNFFALIGDLIFFGFIAACFVLILWPLLRECFGGRRTGAGAGRRWGRDGGGGGGWGGGGGPFYPPGPPPPYSDCNNGGSSSGWRPGFWTGAMTGAAAGYQFGRGGAGRQTTSFRRNDPGEGSSQSSRFSSPTTSTGFGSTRRR